MPCSQQPITLRPSLLSTASRAEKQPPWKRPAHHALTPPHLHTRARSRATARLQPETQRACSTAPLRRGLNLEARPSAYAPSHFSTSRSFPSTTKTSSCPVSLAAMWAAGCTLTCDQRGNRGAAPASSCTQCKHAKFVKRREKEQMELHARSTQPRMPCELAWQPPKDTLAALPASAVFLCVRSRAKPEQSAQGKRNLPSSPWHIPQRSSASNLRRLASRWVRCLFSAAAIEGRKGLVPSDHSTTAPLHPSPASSN